jgi:uncharacterized protein DUF1579
MKRGMVMHRVAMVILACGIVGTGAGAQAQTSQKPGPDQKKLEVFVGTWSYSGEAKQNPYGPAGKITGTDVFEMLPGGFFLTHHWDEKNPIGNLKGVETWGFDSAKKAYAFNYYTSFGEMGSGSIAVTGNTWKNTSTGIAFDGKRAWSRCTFDLTSATTFTVKCDASADGTKWANDVFQGTWTKK